MVDLTREQQNFCDSIKDDSQKISYKNVIRTSRPIARDEFSIFLATDINPRIVLYAPGKYKERFPGEISNLQEVSVNFSIQAAIDLHFQLTGLLGDLLIGKLDG